RRTRRERPDRLEPPLVFVVRRRFQHRPALAPVVAPVHVRAPDLVVRRSPNRPSVSWVQPRVVDLPPDQQRRRDPPRPTTLIRTGHEQPTLRSDQEIDSSFHGDELTPALRRAATPTNARPVSCGTPPPRI